MIGTNMYTTVITLHKQGLSERTIARATSIHRDTIHKIIKKYKQEKIEHPTPFVRASKLDGWKSQIADLLSKNLTKRRGWEELYSQGCSASYPLMVRYINKNMKDTETCIRFFTKPGEEAQVDFGDIGLQ